MKHLLPTIRIALAVGFITAPTYICYHKGREAGQFDGLRRGTDMCSASRIHNEAADSVKQSTLDYAYSKVKKWHDLSLHSVEVMKASGEQNRELSQDAAVLSNELVDLRAEARAISESLADLQKQRESAEAERKAQHLLDVLKHRLSQVGFTDNTILALDSLPTAKAIEAAKDMIRKGPRYYQRFHTIPQGPASAVQTWYLRNGDTFHGRIVKKLGTRYRLESEDGKKFIVKSPSDFRRDSKAILLQWAAPK